MYEGGIRVPAIFRWPGQIKPGTITREVLTQLDVLPLCLRAAGAKPVEGRILDGADPLPVLAEGTKSPHDHIVAHLGGAAALREGRWKIVRGAGDRPWELYDLQTNPTESNDLALRHPTELQRLAALYAAWEADVREDASEPVPYAPIKARK